ncbi:hypothetical protein DFH29DRAFT_1020941 [Suillus ampliporus]|nr:hypothetical protein DFH29DRAFT_1020941 [Suillus ampliporus]
MSGDVNTVATVYGAILLGTCIGCGLTGVLFVQSVLYFKFYPSDIVYNKCLVLAVWALDMMHTILIITSVWECVIVNFDKPELMDLIPRALGLSVAVTAAVTFLVHCFFANRVRKLTKRWYYAAPLVVLAFMRLFAACVSTTEIIRLRHYSLFIKPFPSWIFTVGVTLSASVEFIITVVMVIFLGRSRTGFATMNHIINSLILYTLETGSFTCAVTIASLICWMVMRHNLIFLGMHFAIAKLYANSLLATLNTRKRLRADRSFSSQRGEADVYPASMNIHKSRQSQRILGPLSPTKATHLNVNVETTVVSVIDDPCDDYDMADIESKGCDTACGTEKDSKEFLP